MITDNSLEEITGTVWGNPNYDSSLIIRCHQLRKKKLKTFTVEDFRIMIGQEIDIDILIPIALKILSNNPLAEGDYYPGDLLNNVLRINKKYWAKNTESLNHIKNILKNLKSIPAELNDAYNSFRKFNK